MDTFLYREYAYAKKGIKVIGSVSGRKYKRIGLVAAKVGKTIISPLQYCGVMDSQLFEQWFEECLLTSLAPASTIVMDNASFHRKSTIIPLADKFGHSVIFLPPYSPNLNPIENFWAWLKTKLKNVLRDFDSFDDALGYCFNVI